MDLLSFVTEYEQSPTITDSFYFIGSEYSSLFFSLLLEKIRKNTQLSLIDSAAISDQELKSTLGMSFLGQTTVYWLSTLSEIDGRKRKKILDYLKDYSGSNPVLFFLDSETSEKEFKKTSLTGISIPESFNEETYKKISYFLYPMLEKQNNEYFYSYVFQPYSKVTVNTACQLMEYQLLLGSRTKEFVHTWLDKLLYTEKSLYTLGAAFFAKNEAKFFRLWREISSDYGYPFWISFWSDQLFRAYGFIVAKQKKNVAEAKKIAFRLPFTFVQKDWKELSVSEIKAAHDFLYSLDYNMKNGSSESSLEILFSQFFLNKF